MNKALRKFLFGTALDEEYICAYASSVQPQLECSIRIGKKVIHSIHPVFLGYSPVIFGLMLPEFPGRKAELLFSSGDQIIASIILEQLMEIPLEGQIFRLFKGVSADQHFENAFHRFNFRLRGKLKKRKENNITLDHDLYNQVKIAYSIPREIKVGVITDGTNCNIFPTDLHGAAGNGHYIISLRPDKQPSHQLETHQEITLWSVQAPDAKEIYALGKNHSSGMKPLAEHIMLDADLRLHHGLAFTKMKLKKTLCTEGHHRIYLLENVSAIPEQHSDRLVHLHRTYVQWHLDNEFPIRIVPH